MVTPENLAWLAGIVDGEGSITTQVTRRKTGNISVVPVVLITNSCEQLLGECTRILDELGIKYSCYKRNTQVPRIDPYTGRLYKKQSPVFNLRVEKADRVKELLYLIKPYLSSFKQHNCDIILQYIASRKENLLSRDEQGKITRNKYSREEIELIASIRTSHKATPLEAMLSAPNVS